MAAIAPLPERAADGSQDERPRTDAEIPELMDEKALCAILRISPATARRYRAAGELGFCKYGVKVLYRRHHVIEFLERHDIRAEEDKKTNPFRRAG